jgi:cysteine desulfurase
MPHHNTHPHHESTCTTAQDISGGIYFDDAATTAPDPEVIEAFIDSVRREFGNPSSVHPVGERAALALEYARRRIARVLVLPEPDGVVFTSGGSESAHLGILGPLAAMSSAVPHPPRLVATFAAEHPCVLETVTQSAGLGFEPVVLPVTPEGLADLAALEALFASQPAGRVALVALQWVNNETGAVQPVQQVARLCRQHGALMYCDAVQAPGKLPVDVAAMGAPLVGFSAHKVYAPKGTGLLWVDDSVRLEGLIRGGAQEGGRRAGTQHVAGAVAMAAALERFATRGAVEQANADREALRAMLVEGLQRVAPGVRMVGPAHPAARVAGIVNMVMPGVSGRRLAAELGRRGLMLSSGSACSNLSHGAGAHGLPVSRPSHVLVAMGLPEAEAAGSIRISLGRGIAPHHIARLLDELPGALDAARVHLG